MTGRLDSRWLTSVGGYGTYITAGSVGKMPRSQSGSILPKEWRLTMRSRSLVWISLIILVFATAASWLHNRTKRYDEFIAQSAAQHDLDFDLVKAVVYEESWFRSGIRGNSGELGLMQVTKGAAADYTIRNGFPSFQEERRLLEPRMNVEIGTWYLKQSLDRYKSSPAPELFALLRYNAGEAKADGWLRQALSNPPPAGRDPEDYYLSLVSYPGTREYVRRILRRWRNHNYWF
jgi:soluble lytic murein transglycosylase